MQRRHNRKGKPVKRRTTLTLPADSLDAAERIARARKINLSQVIAEALEVGLRAHAAGGRSEQILKTYQNLFAGFSSEEMMILDGIVLEETGQG